MRRRHLTLLVGSVILGIVAGIVLQNSGWQIFDMILVCFVMGMPFLLVVGVLTAVYSRKLHFGSWSPYPVIIASALILSVAMLVCTVCLIDRWKIEAVKTYVVRAVPVLDRIKAQSGEYPYRLPIEMIGKPPSLLRDYGAYTATANSFCFEYVDEPAGWAGGEGAFKFDSSTRKWIEDR